MGQRTSDAPFDQSKTGIRPCRPTRSPVRICRPPSFCESPGPFATRAFTFWPSTPDRHLHRVINSSPRSFLRPLHTPPESRGPDPLIRSKRLSMRRNNALCADFWYSRRTLSHLRLRHPPGQTDGIVYLSLTISTFRCTTAGSGGSHDIT